VAQIKICGLKERLHPIKARPCDVVHSCAVDALSFPQPKRAHHFFPLEAEDLYYGARRRPRYTIVETNMFEGALDRNEERSYPLAGRESTEGARPGTR
jgi:hypothetical protein